MGVTCIAYAVFAAVFFSMIFYKLKKVAYVGLYREMSLNN
jgi:hypothetical protein